MDPTGVWRVERREDSSWRPQKAVGHVVVIHDEASDFALQVNVYGKGALVRAGAGAGCVEGDEFTIRGKQKAMVNVIVVFVLSHDRSFDVNSVSNRALT